MNGTLSTYLVFYAYLLQQFVVLRKVFNLQFKES